MTRQDTRVLEGSEAVLNADITKFLKSHKTIHITKDNIYIETIGEAKEGQHKTEIEQTESKTEKPAGLFKKLFTKN